MKSKGLNILFAVLIGGFVLLYVLDPLNKQIELNVWHTLFILGLVILKLVNKSKIVDVLIRFIGVSFFVYLLILLTMG